MQGNLRADPIPDGFRGSHHAAPCPDGIYTGFGTEAFLSYFLVPAEQLCARDSSMSTRFD